ncbi:MAG TPA: benzoate-CoA ligase family protein [Anaerolineae bacterium]|nr:benzoate-CoA ligase family protein [Anaerolineae bacterium]
MMRKAAEVPLYYNAVDILERNLTKRADKVALYSPDRAMTFRQVSNEANQVGNALKKLGVRLGDFVGILSPDGPEWVTSFFGTLKIGAIAVGMNTLLTRQEYAYILRDCRARVLIVHESLLPIVEDIRDEQRFLERVVVIGYPARTGDLAYRDWISSEPTEFDAGPTHRDDLCTLNYSSGTTGEPKGIPHAHKDLPLSAQLYGVDALGLCEDDRTFAVAKLFFTYGLGNNLIYPWYTGASVVLSPAPSRIAANVLEAIDRFKPTVLNSVPTNYAAMLAVEGFTEKYDLSSLRMGISAGEALPAPIWHAWKKQTGVEIIEGIGLVENFALFLTNRPGASRPGSTGKPVEGFEIKIVDDDDNPVPPGEVGNLLVKGETASLSYLHQYEKSRRTFRGEWLFTGDKFYVDEDGYYHHVGRTDDMLKVGGIWVSPTEVESVLISHPAVLEVAVVGHPDQADLIKPKAFVALNKGYQPSQELAQELIEHCKEVMSAYKRPRWIEFVDELPKTATGKIQRAKLRSQHFDYFIL